jgi:hypothetical protein
MRKLAVIAMASLMLVGISAVVVAGQMPSNSSRSGTLLSAITGSTRSASPSPASMQNQNGHDEDCADNESQASEQQEGPDMEDCDEDCASSESQASEQRESPDLDDCGKDHSDAAEDQQGTNEARGASHRHGDNQQGTVGESER